MTEVESRKPHVRVAIQGEAEASRVAKILEAVGYEVEVETDLEREERERQLLERVDAAVRAWALTVREAAILEPLVRGSTNAQIARIVGVSKSTASWHANNICAKAGASNRDEVRRMLVLGSPRAAGGGR